MFAAVAANPACASWPGFASSSTAAVAAPLNNPAANPDSTRPSSSIGSPPSNTKHSALAADSPSAQNSTGRRPTSSEKLPARRRTVMTPSAYTAKTTVTISSENPSCSR